MKVLIIDNNIDQDSWGSPDLRRLCLEAKGATLHIRRAPQRDLPASPESFDRIVVSGSKTAATDDAPWISDLIEFMRRAIDLKKPLLGVCYGHQMLARTVGGKSAVRKAEKPEFGWSRIEVMADSPLMNGLPSSFYSFSSHYDEVSQLPAGMKALARSEICAIQAFGLEGYPVYGIQFHPEKTAAEAEETLAKRKKLKDPKILLHPNDSHKLYDPAVGSTLFRNFFSL